MSTDSTDTRGLADQSVLVVGGTKRIGAAIAARLRANGAEVHVTSSSGAPDAWPLDLRDESSVRALGAELGPIDHVVSTASRTTAGPVKDLDVDRARDAIAAKVLGPLLLAKHLDIRRSLTLFSGQVAWRPGVGTSVTGVTNGALVFTASHLAAELAPVRVNTISPGIIDSGLWDAQPGGREGFLEGAASRTLVGSTGTVDDVTDAVLWILGAAFLTGETVRLDGGRR